MLRDDDRRRFQGTGVFTNAATHAIIVVYTRLMVVDEPDALVKEGAAGVADFANIPIPSQATLLVHLSEPDPHFPLVDGAQGAAGTDFDTAETEIAVLAPGLQIRRAQSQPTHKSRETERPTRADFRALTAAQAGSQKSIFA
jgi:hypothetical protein